jgi:nitrite reductase/ring-hydroxylating ferredoxin subunit
VAGVEDIPEDRGLRVRVGEHEIGLFRADGEIHALDNACPHAGFPLSEGVLHGGIVTCSLHQWQFDVRTGCPPGAEGSWPLARYPVSVVNEEIWVELPEE